MNQKEWLRSLKFLLFSVSAGVIQLGGFALLNELLHLDYWCSYLLALVASVIWNFTFNRRYTFQSSANIGRAMLLVFGYYCVFTPLSGVTEPQLWHPVRSGIYPAKQAARNSNTALTLLSEIFRLESP